jgi:hypothetical protein
MMNMSLVLTVVSLGAVILASGVSAKVRDPDIDIKVYCYALFEVDDIDTFNQLTDHCVQMQRVARTNVEAMRASVRKWNTESDWRRLRICEDITKQAAGGFDYVTLEACMVSDLLPEPSE